MGKSCWMARLAMMDGFSHQDKCHTDFSESGHLSFKEQVLAPSLPHSPSFSEQVEGIVSDKLQETVTAYRDNVDLQSFIDGIQQEVSSVQPKLLNKK